MTASLSSSVLSTSTRKTVSAIEGYPNHEDAKARRTHEQNSLYKNVLLRAVSVFFVFSWLRLRRTRRVGVAGAERGDDTGGRLESVTPDAGCVVGEQVNGDRRRVGDGAH